jgi:HSP20 family protein
MKSARKERCVMATIRWYDRPSVFHPFRELERLRKEMDRLYSDFMEKTGAAPKIGVFPPLNVTEEGDNLYVRAELPGINPDDIEISVEGDTLTLKGERKLGEPEENVCYHRRERESGRFRRVITLPTRINTDAVEASFRNGVLKIVLPKAEEALPKQITVKSGD